MANNPFEDPKFGSEKPDSDSAASQQPAKPKKQSNVFEDESYGKDTGLVRSLGDTAVSTAQGFVRGGEMVSNAFDAGSDTSKKFRETDEWLGGFKSGGRRAEQDARAEKMREAEESGSAWEEIKAGAGAFAEAPIDTTVESLGTMAPAIAANVLTRGRAGGTIVPAIGGVQGAGAVKGEIYRAVKQKHLEDGATEEEAEARASEAQSYTGDNAEQIGLGAGLGVLASSTGVEPAAGRIAGRRVAGELAEDAGDGVIKSAGKGVVKEAPVEAAQGGQERLAANISEQNEGFDTPTWEGVAGGATLEGLAGGAAGGGFGAAEGFQARNQRAPEADPLDEDPAPPNDGEPDPDLGPQQFQEPQGPAPEAPLEDAQPAAQDWTAPEPVPEQYRSEAAGERAPLRSQEMGLNPADGPMSGAAAMAVDTGASEQAITEQAAEDGEPVEPNLRPGESIDPQTGEVVQQSPELAQSTQRRAELERGLKIVQRRAREQGWDRRLINQRERVEQELNEIALQEQEQEQEQTSEIQPPQEGVQNLDDHLNESGDRKSGNYSDQGEGFAPAVRQLPGRDKPEEMVNVTRRTADLILEDLKKDPSVEARKVNNRAGGHDVIQRPVEFRQAESQAQSEAIDEAASQAATSPTNATPEPSEAQKEAGNYAMGHTRINGLDITIENPRGSERKGSRPDGSEWSHQMSDHYGYIKTTKGADGDHVDVYVGPEPDNDQVFVVDQVDQESGRFDEHKVMMGYPSEEAAIEAYASNFDEGWKVGPVRPMNVDEFKGWLKDGDTTAEASTAPQAESAPESDIKSVVAKQMPQMSDAELQMAIDHYGSGHKRTKKLTKELAKRQGDKQVKTTPDTPSEGVVVGDKLNLEGKEYTVFGSTENGGFAARFDPKPGEEGTPTTRFLSAEAAAEAKTNAESEAGNTESEPEAKPKNLKEGIEQARKKRARKKDQPESETSENSGLTGAEISEIQGMKEYTRRPEKGRKAIDGELEKAKSDLEIADYYRRNWIEPESKKPDNLKEGVEKTRNKKEAPESEQLSRAREFYNALSVQGRQEILEKSGAGSFMEGGSRRNGGTMFDKLGSDRQRQVSEYIDRRSTAKSESNSTRKERAEGVSGKTDKKDLRAEIQPLVDYMTENARNHSMMYRGESVAPIALDVVNKTFEVLRRLTDAEAQAIADKHSAPADIVQQMLTGGMGWDAVLLQSEGKGELADSAKAAKALSTERQSSQSDPAKTPKKSPQKATKNDSRFADNKLFTSDAVEAARARIKSKMGTLNSGFDPEMAVDGMTIAGAYIESGIRKFSDYASLMVEDFGDKIKPHLLSFWEGARHAPGLDTDGMTSAEDSAREFKGLMDGDQKPESDAIGETVKKPKKRTRKTGQARDRVLTNDWGVDSIDGYGDEFRETGNDTKDAFLKEASLYARAVSDVLSENGFEVAAKRKGKGVSVNQSGVAGSGDVSLEMTDPVTGVGVYLTIGDTSLKGVVPTTESGIAVMYRANPGSAMSGGDNKWAPTDLSAADLAAMIELEASKASKRKEVSQNDGTTRPEVEGADSQGTQGSDGTGERGRASTQPGSTQADTGSVASGQSGNVEGADGSGDDQQAGNGSTGTDVDGNGRPDGSGVSSDGRKGAGGKKQSSAGAGKRNSRKDGRGSGETVTPPPKSPAASGPGNFHYDNPLEIVGGGQVSRFKKNQAAIERYNDIRDTGRPATEEDQRILAAYTGWGSFGQELFQGAWNNPRPKDGWQERDQWLRDQLGQEEWEGMQRSIINAHYTDPPTVMAMWDMVANMGFQGGRVLEPSMGIGNFFGMMPEPLKARSNLAGIELDPVTGGMAKMLYPDANVNVMGYEKSKTPDNFYDVVIGNWPFADIPVPDRKYQKLNPNLHDYFFLKALDQTRPGGLVVGITSHGSMDKKGKVIRNELARKGELVAAYRLPTGAFQEYAGTKVVTDIVILRKRAKPLGMVPSDAGWLESVPYKTPSGEEVFANEYFVNNPDNVIGTIDYGHGTTTGHPGLIVNRPDNVAERLKEIAKNVPKEAYLKDSSTSEVTYVTNHLADREGSLVRDKSGDLGVVRGEYIAKAADIHKYAVKSEKVTKGREAELDSLISMRRAYGELIESDQADSDSDSTAKRKELKNQYEAFVEAHGQINQSFGLKYMRRIDDPFYPALAALERGKDGNYEPSDILTKSTTRERKKLDSPSISEAYIVARNQHINPTLGQIAETAKKPESEVRKELIEKGAIFDLPNGDIEASDIYVSGNVRQKLREAKAALSEGNKDMQRNVEALEKVKPKDIPNFNIEAQMGATWVSKEYYEQFTAEMLGLKSTNGIEATYRAGRWKISMDKTYGHNKRPEANTGSGTDKYPFSRLVNAAISNQTVTIKSKDTDGKQYVNKTATEEVNGKISEMRMKFSEWVWSDPERRDDLEREYNEVRNSYATPTFDGSFMTMEGMALSLGDGPFDLRKHQQDAIWRALVTRKSLNAHEVGTGKTFTMGGIAIESRRYGLAKKPLILAHNANSKTVANEIQQMYPAAKVLYIDNLKAGEIATRMRQIANDDWDAIVMPHSLINNVGFREETLTQMAQQDIDELMEEAYEAAKEDGVEITDEMLDADMDEKELAKVVGKLRSPTAKELVKARNNIIANIHKQAQKSSKEGSIPFEELGIDMVLVDEVHEFKKPPIATKMRIKGMNTQSSDRSIALRFMLKYIRGMNNGGNVHTFSGTPITNSMTEAFHQMRYIMEEEMREAGLDQWDGWFGSFAQEEMDIELTAAGEYESVTRLSKFINTPELRRMIGQYMDVVFSDDMPEMQPRQTKSGKTLTDPSLTEIERAHLLNGRTEGAKDRPYKQVLNTTSDLTPDQKKHFETIQKYAADFREMSGLQRKKAMNRGDPESPIVYEGLAAKVSFDARLMRAEELAGMEGQVPDDPNSKASKTIDNILEIHKSDDRATQVVFTQLGLGKTATKTTTDAQGNKTKRSYKVFSTAHDMVERLVQQGVPREQIAMVTGGTGKNKRAAIAEAMNRSEIRVVIGSTQSLGVGVNMQKNLRAMHHMDAPWMPGDLEQRNGRGQRQGNQWNTVREYRYLTDRIDGRRWQLLVKKQQFIEKFMKSDDSVRIIEADGAMDEDNDMLESFAEAAGDARILQLAKIDKKINMAQRRERLHSQGIANAKRQIRSLGLQIESDSEHVARHEEVRTEHRIAAALSDNAGDNFSITLDGKTYNERGKAQNALSEYITKNIRMGTRQREFATYGDITLTIGMSQNAAEPQLYAKFADGLEDLSNKPTVAAFEARLRGFSSRLDKTRERVSENTDSKARAEQVSKEPFQQASELVRLQKQLADIKADLENNPVAPPAWLRTGAAAETEVLWNGETFTVSGHRWNDAGWFVLAEDASGTVAIPYMEVTDKQGINLYEEREFVPPKVVEKKDDEEAGGSEASFRRTPEPKPGRMSAQKVRSATNSMMRGWNNRPGVTVADSISEFPKGLREAIRKAGAESDMRAVIWKDGIYILAPRIPDRAALEEVVLHEAIGHYGLRKMLGRELTPLLTQVYKDLGDSEAAQDLKNTYFTEGKFNPRNLNHRLTVAEELIAHLAETGQHQNRKLFQRIMTAIRNGLRRLGFTIKINERDLLALLDGAQQTVENGGISRPSNSDINFRRAYHGTPHRFDKFSLEAIGTGDGLQAFGWGLYFASKREVGEFYRDTLSREKSEGVAPENQAGRYFDELLKASKYDSEVVVGDAEIRMNREDFISAWMEFDIDETRIPDSVIGRVSSGQSGALYQVDIPEDTDLLDRDLPLSKQPKGVRGKLKALIKERNLDAGAMTNEDIESAIMLADADADTAGLGRPVLLELAESVGAMEYLGDMNSDPTGSFIYAELSERLGSDKAASEALNDAGIPGLRLLDATSQYRGASEPSHNYVIWDESKVTVESVNDEVAQAEAYFSRSGVGGEASPSVAPRGAASAAVGKKISRKVKGSLSDMKPKALGTLPLMYLRDFAPKSMTALDRYMDERRRMDADRNEMHSEYDKIAQRWLKARIGGGSYLDKTMRATGLKKRQASGLDDLMHDATIMAIDPSKKRNADADKAQYASLKARFDALTADEQKLFTDVRDAYTGQIKAMEETIQANIEKSVAFAARRAQREMEAEIKTARDEMTGDEQDATIEKAVKRYKGRVKAADEGKASRALALRQKFEQMRVDEPYFPLKRFGDYFVSLRDDEGDLKSFSMFESAADMEAAAEQFRKKYPNLDVTVGRKSNKEELREAIDPTFIADIQELITEEVGDESLTDAIYQMYLETLPDFSMRKSFIHRNKTDGYSQDAMRAFASSMFHSSHQIARLKHKLEMDELVEITEEQAQDAEDPVDAMTIANELRLRHEWVMNPQGSKAAQRVTSAAFIYQLGVTPAAALVNTTQTFMLGIPVLGTRFKNEAGASMELLKASKEFASSKKFHMENKLKGEELKALNEFQRMGLIEKTQAHDLAGVGDTGVEYSAVRQKVMGGISFLFHHAERYNREVTSIAAYRMARKEGMGHEAAVKEAAELTWTVHFDYSSGNRARYMQNDTAKILLVFRQHSINMLSRLVIDSRAMFWGESKEVKKEAFRRLAGIYGMFALGAGMMGVPGAQAVLMLLEALDWDDEDPWTMEDKIKYAVTEALGEEVAAAFFRGVPGTLANVDLTNRIGLGHLWFFSPYRELEGRDQYVYWMEQLLGAAPAMLANAASGLSIMGEGQGMRGLETMMPKAGKDLMRSIRYSQEGVQSLNGKSLVDEVEGWSVIAQAIGLTPAHIVEQYEKNSAIKGAEQRIKRERRAILNRFALASRTGDEEMRKNLSAKIQDFNRRNPRVMITGQTIMQSMASRARSRASAKGGLSIDKRLNYLRDGIGSPN